MSQQLDAQGEAHQALGTAVAGYGQRVLSDPHMLRNLVTDLLPDLPRERSLLVTGAEAGLAADIRRHVEEERIDPDTAVQLVARTLAERRAIDPAASTWVASEYAQALGYRVRPYSVAAQSQVIPDAAPTMTAMSGPPILTPPPLAAPDTVVPQGPPQPPSWPPAGQAPSWSPAGQAPSWSPAGQAPSWPPAGQAPQAPSWPPGQGPSGGPPAARKGKKQTIIAAGTAAGVVALYLIVAAVAHLAPFGKTNPVPRPTPTPTAGPSTHKPTPAPSATLAAGVLPLLQLLPQDITDPTTQCQPVKKPYAWSMPGLVSALTCSDPNLPGGSVNGYQMDSRADFDAGWRNFNAWWKFDSARAQSTCPPSGSSAAGLTTWHGQGFPSVRGQVLECEMVTGNAPVYVWTLPTQDMFLVAEGADGSSFSKLNSWWTSSNSGPSVTPSATPSASSS